MRTAAKLILCAAVITTIAEEPQNAKKINVPPLSNGGIASLWYPEHAFLQKEYGEFELLNYSNTSYRVRKDSITDSTWKLVAIGNFLPEGLQYATLAKVKAHPDGALLVMFEWKDPADSTKDHGIFYRTYLSKKKVLLRTRQARVGNIDTLEFSCADIKRRCGQCFYDEQTGEMKLALTGQEPEALDKPAQ
jgi:hypothetical protein